MKSLVDVCQKEVKTAQAVGRSRPPIRKAAPLVRIRVTLPYLSHFIQPMDKRHGFTLVELLVTLAIAAIVLSFAVPSFVDITKDNRLLAQQTAVTRALNFARSEAVKRDTTIGMCASSGQTSCNTTQWENGWMVFTDVNANGIYDAGTDAILAVHEAITGGNTVRATGFTNSGYIDFDGDGALLSTDGSGTFKICDDRGTSDAKAVNVSPIGRIAAATDTSGDGIVNDINNSDITCP